MEKLGATMDRTTKGYSHQSKPTHSLDGLKISNSQVKRLERELKNLKEEVRMRPYSQ
jgi:hypothetical protein